MMFIQKIGVVDFFFVISLKSTNGLDFNFGCVV